MIAAPWGQLAAAAGPASSGLGVLGYLTPIPSATQSGHVAAAAGPLGLWLPVWDSHSQRFNHVHWPLPAGRRRPDRQPGHLLPAAGPALGGCRQLPCRSGQVTCLPACTAPVLMGARGWSRHPEWSPEWGCSAPSLLCSWLHWHQTPCRRVLWPGA